MLNRNIEHQHHEIAQYAPNSVHTEQFNEKLDRLYVK